MQEEDLTQEYYATSANQPLPENYVKFVDLFSKLYGEISVVGRHPINVFEVSIFDIEILFLTLEIRFKYLKYMLYMSYSKLSGVSFDNFSIVRKLSIVSNPDFF